MPCPCKSCTCGDSCTCSPGNPGCDDCKSFQQENAAKASAAASKSNDDSSDKPFNLLVTVSFTDQESEKIFLDSMLPYAAWVQANEPNTLQYNIMKTDKADRGIVYAIIEKYKNKERDFLGHHRNTPQFAEFRAVLKELQDEGKCVVQGESYYDVI